VLAYALDRCGAAARGAPLTIEGRSGAMIDAFAEINLSVGDNSGVEPLAVTPDWILLSGIETRAGTASPLSAGPIERKPSFDLRLAEGAPDFVGFDVLPGPGGVIRAFSLHRAFSNVEGLAIAVVETRLVPNDPDAPAAATLMERARVRYQVESSRRLADLGMLLNIDNFEGIAVRDMGEGRTRLYLISDNNFSNRQRTLLMVFDYNG
jgi:hypothetical protein